MLRTAQVWLLGLFVFGASWTTVLGATLKLQPIPSSIALTPKASGPTGQNVILNSSGGYWVITVPFQTELSVPYEINLEAVPNDYQFEPFDVEIPFFEKKAVLVFHLAPTKLDNTAAAIHSLFATDLGAVDTTGLEELFQTSAAAAKVRMQTPFANMHDYDIQSIYKFLESDVLLSKKTDFSCQSGAEDARNWLAQASAINPPRVNHAAGLDNVKKLISDFDSLNGVKFTHLWSKIKELECNERLPLLQAYEDKLDALPEEERDRVLTITRVDRPTVVSSINQCAVQQVKQTTTGDALGQPAKALLETRLDRTNSEINATASPAARGKLTSDRLTIERVLGPAVGSTVMRRAFR